MALITVEIKDLKGFGLADLMVLTMLVALLGGILLLGELWGGPYTATVQIDLSPTALAGYCLLSLARNVGGLVLSLGVTFWWGLWAVRNKVAERVLIPLVDILQSIPVLGFLPGVVLGLVHLFPDSRIGLELADIIIVFTSQAWNMILAFYQSTGSIPQNLKDQSELAGFTPWQRFVNLELPWGMTPLVWNSMMSMAGGWFFVTVNEAFILRNQDFRLPGVGSYMSVALEQGNLRAMVYAIIAMAVMVIAVDQVVWRPLLAWAHQFRSEEQEAGQEPPSSWMFNLIRRSVVLQRVIEKLAASAFSLFRRGLQHPVFQPIRRRPLLRMDSLERVLAILFMLLLVFGGWRLSGFLGQLTLSTWISLCGQAGLTLARTVGATLLGSLWAIPLGVKIGMNPRWAKAMQPVVQITASFPAPMLFPMVLIPLFWMGFDLNVASMVLMMTGTAWYILFNTISGASTISQEQKDAWACYGLPGWAHWRKCILPAIFPSLLVGWETAMGGAWNASILTEYYRLGTTVHLARGLGATINLATEAGDFALLTAAVFVMSILVVAINRLFWHRLYETSVRYAV